MSKPGRNDPCPCGSGKKYKNCHLGKPDDTWGNDAPTPIAPAYSGVSTLPVHPPLIAGELDDELWDDESDNVANIPYTPLDEAWDLVDEAWEVTEPKEKARLAKEALKLSTDCCGAYFVLAQLEPTPTARMSVYDQAIAAAQRVLAPRTLAELAPFAWIDPEVEYALYSLLHRALALIELERLDEAVAALRHLIELDPVDRLNVRLLLTLQLMVQEELEAALEIEQDDLTPVSDPIMAFTHALLKFQRDGDSVFARRILAEAIMLFPENADLLTQSLASGPLDREEASSETPSAESFDDAEIFDEELLELIGDEIGSMDPMADVPTLYAVAMHDLLWHSTEGAAKWLRDVLAAGPSVRYDNRHLGDGPLLMLTETKQKDYRHCPNCHKPTKFRPVDLVLNLESGEIVDVEVNARSCPACDIVCIAFEDIIRKIMSDHPQGTGRDYMPLGFIADEERRGGANADWLLQHMRPWRKIEDYDANRLEWPTVESQQREIDEWLNQSAAMRLLGPQ